MKARRDGSAFVNFDGTGLGHLVNMTFYFVFPPQQGGELIRFVIFNIYRKDFCSFTSLGEPSENITNGQNFYLMKSSV